MRLTKSVSLPQLSKFPFSLSLLGMLTLLCFRHPSIIGYKEAFFEDQTNSLCMVMEFADKGDILGKIQEHQNRGTYFREADVWRYLIQMVAGLKLLHDMKICHRDIKCANVFLNSEG